VYVFAWFPQAAIMSLHIYYRAQTVPTVLSELNTRDCQVSVSQSGVSCLPQAQPYLSPNSTSCQHTRSAPGRGILGWWTGRWVPNGVHVEREIPRCRSWVEPLDAHGHGGNASVDSPPPAEEAGDSDIQTPLVSCKYSAWKQMAATFGRTLLPK
jgi:hypothetical protein